MTTNGRCAKRDLVLDAIAHRDTGHIPHMIGCQPALADALRRHYGVQDLDPIIGDAVAFLADRLSGGELQERGLLQDGQVTDHWGAVWHGVGETRGQVKEPPLTHPTLKGYTFPDGLDPVVLEQMRGQARASVHKYRVAKLGALWEQAFILRGMEDLLADLLLHPTFVHDLLEGITGYLLQNLELYAAELDVDCIWLSDDYGSQSTLLMSPRLWRTFIAPRLRRIVEAVHGHGYDFALHSDGAIGDVIPDVVEMGIDLLHPVQAECVDVGWVKREFGRQITLWGGYGSQGTLVFGTSDQVRREVHDVCDRLGGGGYIFTPGLGLQNEVPLTNAVALIEVANERERSTRSR